MSLKSVAEFLDPINGHRPTTAERKLIEATQAGEDCWLCDEKNPILPTESTDETRIRASLLRLLITGGTPDCGINERGVALFGGWIEGTLNLSYCVARGRTALRSCNFVAGIELSQTRLNNLNLEMSDLPGLRAPGLKVEGSLSLHQTIFSGKVDLSGGRIGGQLNCVGVTLSCEEGRALNGQRLQVGASLLLRSAVSHGSVYLNGARITGQLDCASARFDGNGTHSLYARSIEVGDDIILSRTILVGSVILRSGKVGGICSFIGAKLLAEKGLAIQAQRLTVKQGFHFHELDLVIGRVDLTAAHFGTLVDDTKSWPLDREKLLLNGLSYDRIAGRSPSTLATRRDWLFTGSHLKGAFHPQPYTQLARVLRQMGHAGEARKVLMERTGLQAKATRASRKVVPNGDVSVGFRSLWADILNAGHWIIDRIAFRVAGYGHAPVRSLWCLLGLFLAATTLAHLAWDEGSFAPNSDVILASAGWAEVTALDCHPTKTEDCDKNPALTWSNTFTASAETPTQGADWDSFNRYGYAADLVVPFLDLGQTDAWAPSKDRGTWGWWLWWLRWVLAAAGWIVTGLGVAAVTGVMQRNQPD